MTDIIESMSKPTDAQQLASELVERVRVEGVDLVGPDGLLTGLSRLYHSILGSVAHECTRAAACPMLIVPVPHAERMPKPAEMRKIQV